MTTPVNVEPVIALYFLNDILTPELAVGHSLHALTGGFHAVLPEGVHSPFGIVRPMTALDDLTGLDNGGLIWVPGIYQVNLYDREVPNYARISPLAAVIYELLQARDGESADGIIYGVHRMRVNADVEMQGDVQEWFINQQFMLSARAY